jgi:ribosomal protein S18 acetylase RimI-like enzyme
MSHRFQVRKALPSDAEAITRVHIDAWRDTYKGIVPDKILADMNYEDRVGKCRDALRRLSEQQIFLVATDLTDNVIGFARAGAVRGSHPVYKSELYAIYFGKESRGQGAGRTLFNAVVKELQERGYNSMLIWVLEKNSAKKFYEAMGGALGESRKTEIGKLLDEVSYAWSDLSRFSALAGPSASSD